MPTPLFESQRQSMMDLLGPAIGCAPADFESGKLTIVERPADVPWYSVFGVTFGVGTVLSVEPSLMDYVRQNAPADPARALRPVLMQHLVEERSTLERRFAYQVPGICWALTREPDIPAIPSGYTLDMVDPGWMAEEVKTGHWSNGIGEFETDARNVRNRYGFVARDSSGAPVAVAGVFETYGMLEIGVDVLPAHQNNGLAPVVVSAAARHVLDAGRIPLYGCAADNIRSQKTALASGFSPVYADAAVSAAADLNLQADS